MKTRAHSYGMRIDILTSHLLPSDASLRDANQVFTTELFPEFNETKTEKTMTKSILRCMIFVMGCLVCAATLVADQPADEATLKRWQEDAEKGNAYAMYNLGRYYADEEYPDREKAFEWFLKSAEKSCVEGEYAVAMCYFQGDGVERNLKEAFKWLKLAASHHNPKALYTLGYSESLFGNKNA